MAKYPVQMVMSETTTAKIGFKDDRLQLSVKMGRFVPTVNLSLTPEDLPDVEKVIAEWKAWLAMPAGSRQTLGGE